MALRIQFKFRQYLLRVNLPNSMLAKRSRYMVEGCIIVCWLTRSWDIHKPGISLSMRVVNKTKVYRVVIVNVKNYIFLLLKPSQFTVNWVIIVLISIAM